MTDNLPAIDVPVIPPARAVAELPAISPEQYAHVGRYSGAVVLACFEMMGGVQRMYQWADSNPTDFYTKLFAKNIQRSTQVDVTASLNIDDAISKLESRPVVYEGEYTEVQPFYDL